MPVTAARAGTRGAFVTRRNGALAVIAGLAAALSVAAAWNPEVARAVDDGVHHIKTVADMLSARSPGHRPKGALAKLKQLKHKRMAAAPLGRHIIPPVAGLLGASGAPAAPVIIPTPVAPPLYNVVAGGPPVPLPPVVPPVAGGGGGGGGMVGPPIFSPIPTQGGGGGFIPPPIITLAVPPPVVTSAVPEPASWAMMLVGFALLGSALRRKRGTAWRSSLAEP